MDDTIGRILGYATAAAFITVLVTNPDEVTRLIRSLTGAGADVLMAVQGR